MRLTRAQWDALCSLQPLARNPLPGVYSQWDWMNYQINLCADNAQNEASAACYAALREMHSTCNTAIMDIARVRNGRIIKTGADKWLS